jgi:Holliday junction resolvase RusA-like endonuclease
MQILRKLRIASTTRPKNHRPCAPPPFSQFSACQRPERRGFFFHRHHENPLSCLLLLARLFHFLQKIEATDCFTNMAGRVVLFRADAVIAASAAGDAPPTIYIDIQAPPMVQQRPRVRFLPLIRTPLIYDPSQRQKRAYRVAVMQALAQLGVAHFPIFPHHRDLKLRISAIFFVQNINKDLDNLLKFVFDALQGAIYLNDRVIWEVTAKKVQVANQDQFTQLEIEQVE